MKRFILLSLLLIITSTIIASSYEELFQDFKEQLYSRQAALMDKEEYFVFITPLLEQAETQLLIPKFLNENPNCFLAQEYFSCLLDYNVCCFEFYIRDIPVERTFNSHYYEQLRSVIAKIIIEMIKTPEDEISVLGHNTNILKKVREVIMLAEKEAKSTAHFLYDAKGILCAAILVYKERYSN